MSAMARQAAADKLKTQQRKLLSLRSVSLIITQMPKGPRLIMKLEFEKLEKLLLERPGKLEQVEQIEDLRRNLRNRKL